MIFPQFRFLGRFFDAYYIRQINTFTDWLKRHSLENEGVFIDLPWQERFLQKGPLTFVFTHPGGLNSALEKNNIQDNSDWQSIFKSSEYEIWENKKNYDPQSLPLRFGLTQEEKNFALKHARAVLNTYLKTGERIQASDKNIPTRFREKASVDVALWVSGHMRGSRIVEDMPLIEAITEAAVRSSRDERFKPVSLEELDRTRIEIAVLSDLKVPLLQKEIDKNIITPEKGYIMTINGKRGWYLPAVLNCLTFQNLEDFLTYLIEDKVGVSKKFLAKANISVFEVDNFIESSTKSRNSLTLNGPVVKREVDQKNLSKILEKMARNGADFLCRLQEDDGNIVPIIHPLTGKKTQIDWVRLPLSAWSVALIGKSFNISKYLDASRKTFAYITKNIYEHPYLSHSTLCLSLIYTYKLAKVFKDRVEIEKIHKKILELLPQISYEPILYSQVALHLLERDVNDPIAKEFVNKVLEDYENLLLTGQNFELARFPELINILNIVGKSRNDQTLLDKSKTIARWYKSQQLENGSFLSRVGSNFAYVRGSGKIFEILCLEPIENRSSIERIVPWLLEMQYDENNTYFVREELKEIIIGGFRHDYVNQSVWIDATAHVLVAATRLKLAREGV